MRRGAEWQLMHINGGYGDHGGWYFDNTSSLQLNSSNFNGFLGKIFGPAVSLAHIPPCTNTGNKHATGGAEVHN